MVNFFVCILNRQNHRNSIELLPSNFLQLLWILLHKKKTEKKNNDLVIAGDENVREQVAFELPIKIKLLN
jgi:hypothetical protein